MGVLRRGVARRRHASPLTYDTELNHLPAEQRGTVKNVQAKAFDSLARFHAFTQARTSHVVSRTAVPTTASRNLHLLSECSI